MTIQEALEMLRVVIPARERTIGIVVQVMDYDHYELDNPKRREIEFRVWDGRENYNGPTLDIAIQKALLANSPDRGVIEDAEPFVAEARVL